jgi:hypothetical protein
MSGRSKERVGKGKRHKSQHYVPRTYLGAWCDPTAPRGQTPYVWLFEKNSRQGKRKSPKNVFEETDFYTITRADGSRNLIIEDNLAKLEDRFAKIRAAKLEREEPLTSDERLDVVAFFAAMSFRTKAHRDFMREQWGHMKELGDAMIDELRQAKLDGRRLPPPLGHSHDPARPSLSHEQVSALAAHPIQHMLATQMEVNLPIFAGMDMLVLTAENEVGFITSDHPCVWVDPDAYKRPPMFRQPRLLSRDIELSLPISPRQILILNRGLSGYMRAGRPLLDEYNRRTRHHAYEYFVVRKNATYDRWFSAGTEPDDSWEKTRSHAPETTLDNS